MSEVNEEEQTSAISNSAWDHRKQRSFIIDSKSYIFIAKWYMLLVVRTHVYDP